MEDCSQTFNQVAAMKIAIVHEWFVSYAGAEKVVEQILKLFPAADVFVMVDFLPETDRGFLKGHKVTTSFIQHLPFSKKKYRAYLPLMPLAVEQFDLSAYNLIISSSHAVAKGVITGPNQLHVSYVHSPMRYAWDLQHQYLRETGLIKGFKGWVAKYLLHRLRIWDLRTANGVDIFISNSAFIAKRIWKIYRRDSQVIFPPVNVDAFSLRKVKED
ncbi:MAG: glycosyltransferase, partial [Thiotrichales bacterium]